MNGNKQCWTSFPPAAPKMSITLVHGAVTAIQWLDLYLDVDSKVQTAIHWGEKS